MDDIKANASSSPDHEKEIHSNLENEKELVNTSGHVQEIDRTFSVVSVCFMSVLTDNVSLSSGLIVKLSYQVPMIHRPGVLAADHSWYRCVSLSTHTVTTVNTP